MIENAEFRAEASKHFKALAKRYLRTNGHMCRKVQTALEAVWDMNEIAPLIYDAEGNRLISNARLRELASAERDGRVVVLPCKIGVDVYAVLAREVLTCVCVGWRIRGGNLYMLCMDRETGHEYSFFDFHFTGGITGKRTVFLTKPEAETARAAADAGKGE